MYGSLILIDVEEDSRDKLELPELLVLRFEELELEDLELDKLDDDEEREGEEKLELDEEKLELEEVEGEEREDEDWAGSFIKIVKTDSFGIVKSIVWAAVLFVTV